MYIRKTEKKDVAAVSQIYAEARAYMRALGNPDQWPEGYPGKREILADIADGVGYVCEEDGEIIAVFHYKCGIDPTYVNIYEGEWLNSLPYAVIHRIAVKYHGRGIVRFCFDECFKRMPNIKIDTHKQNLPMQRALEKAGFKYCGIIYLENGAERIAYQKCL